MNDVLELLKKLNIDFTIVYHQPVYTVEEAQSIKKDINGIGCKNLFLKDKYNYYLYVLRDDVRADLKLVGKTINIGPLSFASVEELMTNLKLTKGSVTPLGLINNDKTVILLLDKSLKDNKILIHPNTNTATISINYEDLLKFVNYCENTYYEI